MLDFLHGAMLFLEALVLVSEGNLVSTRLPSWCNVFIAKTFLLVIERMLARARFPSWSILVFGNALVLVP